MTDIIAGGVTGLLLGMAAQGMGLGDRARVTASIALRERGMVRATLHALGIGAVLTAFLGWLAVVDVDTLTVLPLHGGTILGAIVFGAAAGLSGVTLGGALTMTGGGRLLEGVCAVVGCLIGAAVLPWVARLGEMAQGWFPAMGQTWFRVTLDEPYLFSGGFLGQACLGAVMMAFAVLIGPEPVPEPADAPPVREVPPVSTDAQEVREETVVATLPGEEPVVVDTAAPEEAAPDSGQAEPEEASPAEDAPVEDALQEGDTPAGEPPEAPDAPPADDAPVMQEHPELDDLPEDGGDWTERMARLEEGAGQGTPVQEEALPVGAKVVGEPERRDADEEEDEHLG
ncbi:MAG: hypothetical protein ACI4MJ_09205 [Aristaeellaceae bacterium]